VQHNKAMANECDKVTTVKTSNTNSTGKQGSNFLVLKKDEEYSSSEDEQSAYVPTLGQKEYEEAKRNDDNDENEHVEPEEQWPDQENEENSEDDEDTDEEDKYGEDTDDDYEGLVFLQGNVKHMETI